MNFVYELYFVGEYTCTGPCGGKRLIADKFSKKSLTNFKEHGKPLRCKQCVEEALRQEQNVGVGVDVSDDKKQANTEEIDHPCSSCKQLLSSSHFNRNQLNKGEGKQRCKQCVHSAETAAAQAIAEDRAIKILEAEDRLRLAEASKNTADILAASSALASLEAQAVTGVQSKRGGGGRGRSGGKGRGGGRDRGGGSCWSRR